MFTDAYLMRRMEVRARRWQCTGKMGINNQSIAVRKADERPHIARRLLLTCSTRRSSSAGSVTCTTVRRPSASAWRRP